MAKIARKGWKGVGGEGGECAAGKCIKIPAQFSGDSSGRWLPTHLQPPRRIPPTPLLFIACISQIYISLVLKLFQPNISTLLPHIFLPSAHSLPLRGQSSHSAIGSFFFFPDKTLQQLESWGRHKTGQVYDTEAPSFMWVVCQCLHFWEQVTV